MSVKTRNRRILSKNNLACIAIWLLIVTLIGGLAIVLQIVHYSKGPNCSDLTHQAKVGSRETMLQVIREETIGARDIRTDFLAHMVTELNPDIDPGRLSPSDTLTVPNSCQNP